MQIDLEQITCFLTVARLKSFTKAANVLYKSQPAVSRKVSSLESELNVELIQRGKRNLSLTAAGVEFQRFFNDYHTRLFALQEKHATISAGKIAFGIFHGCDLMDTMGDFVDAFQSAHPSTELFGTSGDVTTLLDGLRTGQFDFIIGPKEPFLLYDDCQIEDIGSVRRMVVYAKENPLSAKTYLTIKDFANQPYYAFYDEKTPMEIRANKQLFARYGIFPTMKQMQNMDSILMALRRGTGFILLDEHQRIITNTAYGHFLLPDTQMLSLAYKSSLKQDNLKYDFVCQLLAELKQSLR